MLLCRIVTSSHRQIKIGEICEGGGGKKRLRELYPLLLDSLYLPKASSIQP